VVVLGPLALLALLATTPPPGAAPSAAPPEAGPLVGAGLRLAAPDGAPGLVHPLLAEVVEGARVSGGPGVELRHGPNVLARLPTEAAPERIAAALVEALEARGIEVPGHLRLLAAPERASTAIYEMYCFWTGEVALGRVPGVRTTRPGFAGGHEVVEVVYDPGQVSLAALDAAGRDGAGARRSSERSVRPAPDSDDKRQLRAHPLRHLPMTEAQRTKVNAELGARGDPGRWLSPRQRRLAAALVAEPGRRWPRPEGGLAEALARLEALTR
jgi:hypothetical protein